MMMKTLHLTISSIFIFGITIASVQEAKTIPSANLSQEPQSPDEDDFKEPIGKGLNLISFTVGRFQDSKQFLEVPNISPENHPKVIVQYPAEGYHWTVKDLRANGRNLLQAQAPNDKVQNLNKLGIAANQLFAKAEVSPPGSSTPLYVPVILERSAEKYEFSFYCNQCKASIKKARVISSGKQISCQLSSNPTITRVMCDKPQAKEGRFRLSVSGSLRMFGSTRDEPISDTYNFRHNTQWLN